MGDVEEVERTDPGAELSGKDKAAELPPASLRSHDGTRLNGTASSKGQGKSDEFSLNNTQQFNALCVVHMYQLNHISVLKISSNIS